MKTKTAATAATETPFGCKAMLTSAEAAQYMGVSLSHLYRLTMNREIPHYKPRGKMCYFDRAELEQWLHGNRVATDTELTERATAYCRKNGR